MSSYDAGILNQNVGPNESQWFGDPFADYSSSFMPRDIRTMLLWCERLWANNGVYRSALERVCSYFLTSVDIMDVNDNTKRKYEEFLNDKIYILSKLRSISLDYIFYGNSFVSLYLPFRRSLRCKSCALERPIERMLYTYRTGKFYANCRRCGSSGEHEVADRRTMEADRVQLVRWNPHYMRLVYHPVAHCSVYYYQIPEDLKMNIRKGVPFFLQYTPMEFLEAVNTDSLFEFDNDVIFHMKEDTLAGLQNRGWGVPRAFSVFKQGMHIQVLKRYNEAIALDYIVPWRILTPGGPRGSDKLDPLLHADLGQFSSNVKSMIAEHRKDPLAVHSLPFPVEYQVLGGEGRQLAPHDLITIALDELLNSCDVPAELYKGSLSIQAMPAALRLFESSWPHLGAGQNRFLNWMLEKLAVHFNWDRARGRMRPVTRADDMEARMIRLQLSAANKISDTTALAGLGIDVREEIRRIFEERKLLQKEEEKMQREQEQTMEMQRRLAETSMALRGGGPGVGGSNPGAPMGGPGGPPPMGAPGTGSGGLVTPGDVMQQADQLAQQLLAMPEGERRRQLNDLKQSDETLHAAVKQKLQNARSEARSVGQDQVLAQMYGGA